MYKDDFDKPLSTEQCPARQILTTIGDKWSILVLILLDAKGKVRFNDLVKGLDGISPKVLSKTLQSLEQYGLVERIVHSRVPPKVEYGLTNLSNSLLPHVIALSDWASENMDEIMQNRVDYLMRTS